MDNGKRVWAPDIAEGFIIGEVCDFGTDTITVQPMDGSKTVEAPFDSVFPAEEEGSTHVDDNCGLMFLNEGTMLHNLKLRYKEDFIYTYTANILLALNPYFRLPMYTPEICKQYQGKSLGVLPPHIYAIADKAYRDMRNLSLSQSIMCSGESGAGKTESTKHLLRFLTDSYGGGGDIADLEQRILAANPFMEAYGNAKTTRNNNSSRFGKFVELHFNRNSLVVGAHIIHYLLEKSRIIEQSGEERNYQVFYRLCRGAPKGMRDALNISEDAGTYNFMKHSMLGDIPFLDDVKDFAEQEKSMSDCGLESSEKADIFRITAAVMHLGNIEFEDGEDGASLKSHCDATVTGCAAMMGLDVEVMKQTLVSKTISIAGTESKKALTTRDAQFGLWALAKTTYSRLFDWIIDRINTCFPYPQDKSVNFIGILDIAGFEYFRHNSFEQFCINFCNEKLQQFFNERVLKDEQELYVKESIKFKEVEFVDNQDCIDLIEAPKTGILSILDDVSRMPKANDTQFAEKLHSVHAKHFRLQVPRKSKMSYYKSMRDNEGFIIRHFAGAVCYDAAPAEGGSGFLDKNNDALVFDMAEMMGASKDPFTRKIYEKRPGEPEIKRGKLTVISLGDKFKKALAELMEKLSTTRATFVRCIKPNQKMKPKMYEGAGVLSQLQCAGMVSVLDLMQGGYPSRTQFKDLYDMYKAILPPALAKLDPRTFAKALFKALGMSEEDFQFGVSKVFFRPGKFAEFDTIMKADPASLEELVGKVLLWLVKCRWKKITWACVSCIKFAAKIRARGNAAIIMQNVIKMYLAKELYRPRYMGIKELLTTSAQIEELKETVNRLPKNKDKYMKQVEEVLKLLDDNIQVLKTTAGLGREDVKKMQASIQAKIDKSLESVRKEQQKQKLQEEAARLKKLAEEMERKRKEKEAAEKARIEAEAEAKLRKEMEAQAKKDQEQEEKEEEAMRIKAEKAAASKKGNSKEAEADRKAAQEAAMMEQERRDQELAMRLAMDAANPTGALSEDAQKAAATHAMGGAKRKVKVKTTTHTFANKKQEQLHKKHDLSKWKYADLRDTINTSCDIDLLEACREEFHRRLKVYHAWKMKNVNKSKTKAASRNPAALSSAAASRGAAPPPPKKKKTVDRPQRYFRIPFVKPGEKKTGAKKGWWYAHFDGQWIARQMELHPEKSPVLLTAGRDDMEMCELSLEETGLTRKRGAEILPREFEAEWGKHGGEAYVSARSKGKRK
jgi:myosin-6